MDNIATEVVSTAEQCEVSQTSVVELNDLQLAVIGGGIADVIGV